MAHDQASTHNEPKQTDAEEKHSLKGAFVSVMILGGFIIASWFGVWFLFLSR